MEPHSDINWGVVGFTASGKLQVIPLSERNHLCTSPLRFFECTWDELLACCVRVKAKPKKRLVTLSDSNQWLQFNAWQCRHWWMGNPMLLRCHAFFRTMRQTPTSSNVIRKGNRTNYVDAKGKVWSTFNKSTKEWVPVVMDNISHYSEDIEMQLEGKLSTSSGSDL